LALGLISLLIFALVVYFGAKTNTGKYAEALTIQPFYQAVIHTSQDSTPSMWINRIQRDYGDNFTLYCTQILRVPPKIAYQIFQNPYIDSVSKEISLYWGSNNKEITQARADLNIIMENYVTYFGDSTPPPLLGMMSMFGIQVALSDSAIWIGLDLFMNPNYRFYQGTQGLHAYQIRRTYPYFLPPVLAYSIAEDKVNHSFESLKYRQGNLLNLMLREGLILSIAKNLNPQIHDSLLLGYTTDQWLWIENNELDVWRKIISEGALYTNDPVQCTRYIGDGPFTNGLTNNSPPSIGKFFGYRIIQHWLDKRGIKTFNSITKQYLSPSRNNDLILKESEYRGRGLQ